MKEVNEVRADYKSQIEMLLFICVMSGQESIEELISYLKAVGKYEEAKEIEKRITILEFAGAIDYYVEKVVEPRRRSGISKTNGS